MRGKELPRWVKKLLGRVIVPVALALFLVFAVPESELLGIVLAMMIAIIVANKLDDDEEWAHASMAISLLVLHFTLCVLVWNSNGDKRDKVYDMAMIFVCYQLVPLTLFGVVLIAMWLADKLSAS